VVPGFVETHDHLFMSSNQLTVTDVSPFITPTLASALEKIRATEPDDDGWIVAFGADQTLYEEKKGPTRDLLDDIFPNTPVIVFHLSGHGGFANSQALRRAGVDKTTPDPQGGFFEKDASGELTGFLSGQPALFMVARYPMPTPQSARAAAQLRAEKGVTTASEFALMNPFVLEQIQAATSDPSFPVRVVGGLFVTAPGFEELAPRIKNYETDLFHVPFVKTWTDGSVQGGTAHLSQGYHEHSFGQGGAQGSQEYFNDQVLRIYELGLWPAIHANADGAVDVALNAIENAQKHVGRGKTRPQIIHAQYTRPDQIKRMAELGVFPTFFTTHVYYWGDLHYERTLGPERAQRLSAMNDAFEPGLMPSMHNDPPVTPVDPLHNMWVAVNRRSSGGRTLGADQAITPKEALQAYTSNAAYQFGMENEIGTLAAGKYADFVVLDRSPLDVEPDEIRDIRVVATVRGGRITYAETSSYDRIDPPGGEK
jgi:predicted amidohydrolase YtcJ